MIADIMNKILLTLFWVGTTLQNMVIWVWVKVKQLLTWRYLSLLMYVSVKNKEVIWLY